MNYKKRRFHVYALQAGFCYLCGTFMDIDAFEVDHYIELREGADPEDEGNWRATHVKCHHQKTAETNRRLTGTG